MSYRTFKRHLQRKSDLGRGITSTRTLAVTLFIGLILLVLRQLFFVPIGVGEHLGISLMMIVFTGLMSFALVPSVAALLLVVAAVPVWLFFPLIRAFLRHLEAKAQGGSNLDEAMHRPEADPLFAH